MQTPKKLCPIMQWLFTYCSIRTMSTTVLVPISISYNFDKSFAFFTMCWLCLTHTSYCTTTRLPLSNVLGCMCPGPSNNNNNKKRNKCNHLRSYTWRYSSEGLNCPLEYIVALPSTFFVYFVIKAWNLVHIVCRYHKGHFKIGSHLWFDLNYICTIICHKDIHF